MLVCNVSLRPPRAGISADIAEAAAALDDLGSGSGQVVFATLVDDPASVGETVDAYLGQIMLEAASAADVADASIPAVYAATIVETMTTTDTVNASLGAALPITGVIGWWDASVTASLTLSGANILSVADQSGLGNTMASGETGAPTYSATGFNSTKPAMIFTAVFQNLKATPFPMGTGNTLTFWLVTTMPGSGTSAYGRYFSYQASTGGQDWNSPNTWIFAQNNTVSTQGKFQRNSIDVITSSVTASPAPHRIIGTVTSAGAVTVYIDGVSVASGTSGGNWVNGGNLRLGSDSVSGSFLTAPIAECGVATSYSDATAVAALDNYLKTKWGL